MDTLENPVLIIIERAAIEEALRQMNKAFCLIQKGQKHDRFEFDIDPTKTSILRRAITSPMFVLEGIDEHQEIPDDCLQYGADDLKCGDDGYSEFLTSLFEHLRMRMTLRSRAFLEKAHQTSTK